MAARRSRTSSARLRSVTSLAAPNHSTISPFASCSGVARENVQPKLPVHAQHTVFQFEYALGPDGLVDGRRHPRLIIRVNVVRKPVAVWRFRVGEKIPST